MESIKNLQGIDNTRGNIIMENKAPVISIEKKRIEKIVFRFDNPGDVEIEVPVLTCEETGKKFFHPDDFDAILDQLDTEYERVHKLLKK